MVREKSSCGSTYSTWFAWRITIHCACPSFSLQPGEAYSHCNCTRKVLGTLRATTTLVRLFMYF